MHGLLKLIIMHIITVKQKQVSFIRPKLDYGCQIQDDCTDREKEKLEKFQLTAARIVTGAKKRTSHQFLYEETQCQKLSDRRMYIKLN